MTYILKRSNRKTISIEVTRDCEIIVRAPRHTSTREIERVLEEKKSWLKRAIISQREKGPQKVYTAEEIEILKERARDVIPKRVEYYSKIMGVSPKGISITSAQKRFGSCSSKGRISFTYRLMDYPMDAIDYVVVHELAHLKVMKHNKEFYRIIEEVLPDYKERIKILKEL